MDVYSAEVVEKMKRLYDWLSEKDRRRYAAVEALKLGHGGTEYIARIFQCDPKTIRQGMQDLAAGEDPASGRVRKRGWPLKASRSAIAAGNEFATVVAGVHSR